MTSPLCTSSTVSFPSTSNTIVSPEKAPSRAAISSASAAASSAKSATRTSLLAFPLVRPPAQNWKYIKGAKPPLASAAKQSAVSASAET